uniref:Uncharacterized protein n=1 Tax=Zea mays TaxID=4577 RepID=C0PNQ9_MAIZE|nr:unknown [Zea mays]
MVPGRKGFNAQGNPAVIWAVILIALLLWSHTHLIENGLVTGRTTDVLAVANTVAELLQNHC